MKQLIAKNLSKLTKIPQEEIENLIAIPPSSDLGDFAFPCFSLAKSLKKNPAQIASELAEKFPKKGFEKIETKGPYLNFFVDKKAMAEKNVFEILKQKNKFGSQKISSKNVMIEFSQANTHKAFHVGHIRGTSLGESLARISEFCGDKVIRANYQGDTGMHVAKWLWCYTKFHKKEKLKKDEIWIANIYVEAVKRLEENSDLQSEVDEINRKLGAGEDSELNSLWKKTRQLSLDVFENIYSELNTKFDEYYFESEVETRAKEIAGDLLKKKIAEISEEAVIVDLEKYDLGVLVILRKDGTVLYSAKDLALAEKKFKKYSLDKSIHVVGSAQRFYFQQLFKIFELIYKDKNRKFFYVPVSEVRFPWGKMSSRTGDNVLYSEFLEELTERLEEEISKRSKLSKKELEERALKIAIAAIKYAVLKQDTNKNFIFNKEESMKFEGDTGPYLLYSYARAKSILKKSSTGKYKIPKLEESEKKLILELSKFPEVVKKSYENLAPNNIANYAFELAQTFNEFYHSTKVVGSENEKFRLALVASFAQILKNSLNLLGIETLEEM